MDWLRGRFVARLIARRASHVLDVGCGGGACLRLLRDAGVEAVGVESGPEHVEALRAEGFSVEAAPAEALPFDDDAFEWVSLRHVLHHLRDPRTALREAARVARAGLVIAEPWYDVEVPSQRNALEVERWMKAQDRRLGKVHDENLTPHEIALALPGGDWRLEQERCLRLTDRDFDDVVAAAERRLADLPPGSEPHRRFEELRGACREHGISHNGSAIVVAVNRETA